MRVAIGSIFTECNELGGIPIERESFEHYELLFGDELLALDTGVVGGMLQVLKERALTPVPLLWASSLPGGPLSEDCYFNLIEDMLARLINALPIDGVLLPLHGAASVARLDNEQGGDLEGDLLTRVRAIVGKNIPIIATLDLHAHVTSRMVENADALLAWETYPHTDTFETGQRGARLIADTLSGLCKPTMAAALVPVITSAINGGTEANDPFAKLMRKAKGFEERPKVLSTSILLVHPYLDQPQMGSGAIVVTNNDLELAKSLAQDLAHDYWSERFELEPTIWTPEAAIKDSTQYFQKQSEHNDGPIVLVETADCCGGGASGDSVAVLKALLAAQQTDERELNALVPVVDPKAAQICHGAGQGNHVSVTLGHKLDKRWGKPISIMGEVVKLADGHFIHKGGVFDGVDGAMGPSVLLKVDGITILIMSRASYDWRDEQWRTMGIDPRKTDYIVAKNPMNYHQVYNQARAVYILDTAGPTPATLRHVKYKNLKRPYFPLDDEIVESGLRVLV